MHWVTTPGSTMTPREKTTIRVTAVSYTHLDVYKRQPHGCCNAILLPSVIQFNSRVCMSRYAQIARALGLPGATDKQLTDSLVEAVRAMNEMCIRDRP